MKKAKQERVSTPTVAAESRARKASGAGVRGASRPAGGGPKPASDGNAGAPSTAPVLPAVAVPPSLPALPPVSALPHLPVAKDEAARTQSKPKLVRDSFTIPKAEYAVLEQLKHRATRLIRPTKKSELLRAGLAALNVLPDDAFLAALERVPSLKTGRPKSA